MNIIEVIRNLNNLFHLTPASEDQIYSAEKELQLSFSEEYKAYLKEYGVISAKGIELTGITESKRLNVVDVTKQERELNSNLPYNMYVIENIAIDGIIILQSENGEIYSSTPGTEPRKLYNSLCEYIASR